MGRKFTGKIKSSVGFSKRVTKEIEKEYDREKLMREFQKGELVLEQIPGLDGKLEEACVGPFR